MKSREQELLEVALDEAHRSLVSGLAETLVMELNNPLAIIHGRTYQIRAMLSKSPIPREAILEILTKLDGGVDRLTKLTRGLGQICRETESSEKSSIAVADILALALEIAGESSRYRDVHLTCEFAPEAIFVEADAQSVLKAVLQAVMAAIEVAQASAQGRVAIRSVSEGTKVLIRIETSGTWPGAKDQKFRASQKRRLDVMMMASRALIENEGGMFEIETSTTGESDCVIVFPIAEVIA